MPFLRLKNEELKGALAVATWLEKTIEEEGMDRPAFRSIAQYIVSDLRDAAVEGLLEPRATRPLGDFLNAPPKLPNIMDLKGKIL